MESSKAAVISIGKMSKRLKHPLLEFDSNEKEFVLGRNREAQCMILDVNVSRRHASLKHLSGQGWSITDNKVMFSNKPVIYDVFVFRCLQFGAKKYFHQQ